MKIEWATDEVKAEVESKLAVWYQDEEITEEDPEKFMKELGWEYMPFDMNAKPYDAIALISSGVIISSIVCAGVLIELGARLQEEGVKELTLLYTDIDETLWGKRG